MSVSVTLSAGVFVRLCQVSNRLSLAVSLCLSDSVFFSLSLFLSVILSLAVSVSLTAPLCLFRLDLFICFYCYVFWILCLYTLRMHGP